MRLPSTIERLLAGLALCGAFLLMASVFVPGQSSADPSINTQTITGQSDPHAGLLSLGEIADANFRVNIFSGPEGPVYSVFEAQTGQVLGTLLTPEQVSERFPELPLPDMDFDTVEQFSIEDGAFPLSGE